MVNIQGAVSVMSSNLSSLKCFIMQQATYNSAGPTAKLGIAWARGKKKSIKRNPKAMTNAVSPVRPPASIPAADSIKGEVLADPRSPATAEAAASAVKLLLKRLV